MSQAAIACVACGENQDVEDVTEAVLGEYFELDVHIAAKDGGDPPLVHCPEYLKEVYVVEENRCAGCDFSLEGYECAVCSKSLDVDDYEAGDGNLCSYHAYVMSKDD